ncbi:photosystem I P700 apoprotein A2 [Tanacetum coccineum]
MSLFLHPEGSQWNLYAQNPDSSSHLFGTSQGAGTVILTLLGGFHPQTQSLWLTDMAHHHLAIAFIFLIAGHMYRTNFGIRHSMKDLLDAHIPSLKCHAVIIRNEKIIRIPQGDEIFIIQGSGVRAIAYGLCVCPRSHSSFSLKKFRSTTNSISWKSL